MPGNRFNKTRFKHALFNLATPSYRFGTPILFCLFSIAVLAAGDACYDRCAPHFLRGSSLWELNTSPRKTDLDKTKLLTGQNIPWPRYTMRITKKQMACFRQCLDKECRYSNTISDEKCYLFIAARGGMSMMSTVLKSNHSTPHGTDAGYDRGAPHLF